MSTTKLLSFSATATATVPAKSKQKIVTETKAWQFAEGELLDSARQSRLLDPEDPRHLLALAQIQQKLRGYRSQDQDKDRYDAVRFVDLADAVRMLEETRLQCFYCRRSTMILYPQVREPRQWTLERIDNAQGHNRGNVEIACLTCNLRRRTMHYERYVMTKKMVRVIKLESDGTQISLR